ncbi:hypothetical protein [Rubrolithibacter danxiaensis]|uniref:hypothetical protein n=1 Tax=Rubrolithibacter danxiaensis TaxID=3390805 RepID=UPI003BF7D70A
MKLFLAVACFCFLSFTSTAQSSFPSIQSFFYLTDKITSPDDLRVYLKRHNYRLLNSDKTDSTIVLTFTKGRGSSMRHFNIEYKGIGISSLTYTTPIKTEFLELQLEAVEGFGFKLFEKGGGADGKERKYAFNRYFIGAIESMDDGKNTLIFFTR